MVLLGCYKVYFLRKASKGLGKFKEKLAILEHETRRMLHKYMIDREESLCYRSLIAIAIL